MKKTATIAAALTFAGLASVTQAQAAPAAAPAFVNYAVGRPSRKPSATRQVASAASRS